MTISLPGYTIFREAARTPRYVIYRGIREKDQKPVLIKTLAKDHPSIDDIAHQKNEYALLKNLSLPSVLQTYALEEKQNSYFLVLEDTQDISLNRWMRQHPDDLKSRLKIAISITKALEELQNHEVIHKDIQPINILVNPLTLTVQLTGFDFATTIPRQKLSLKTPHLLEGTLAYMSPEQTGRMNREMDYRTDFYSLGVTFYQLFTETLPFVSSDPMELIHSHLAKTATPPDEVNHLIPKVLSDIIMKLLSKKAEERYGSCFSLIHDLETCLEALSTYGCIEPFPIGQNDLSQKLQISEKIYGREQELKTLLSAFEEVCLDNTQLFLLAGYPGIGKSSIVQEIHKPILEKHGFFISGKFDQYKANIPYSAFIGAFQDLIQQIVTQNDEVVAIWREKLRAALGNNAQVIMEVIPELRYVINERPVVQAFDTQETQNRFNFFLQKFISLYASPQSPLVIFLDDLQWIDPASLQLLEMILTTLKTKGLFLIGAYRSNEVLAFHPLLSAMERISRNGGIIKRLDVGPIALQDVQKLVADTLHTTITESLPLSSLIYAKTHGNPFFIHQLLAYLYQEKFLIADPKRGVWCWELERIQELNVSENVIDLLLYKLRRSTLSIQRILATAACIGNTFDMALVAKAMDISTEEAMEELLAATKDGFLILEQPKHSLWQTSQEEFPQFRFLHDKVQQAAYQLMNDAERKTRHYQLGLLLLNKYIPAALEEHIFEIMAQLNPAAELITESKERHQYAEMNLIAAKKAMRTVAYDTALEFVRVGIAFLPKERWETDYELSYKLHLLAAESTYLLCNFDEADRLFEALLQYSKNAHDRVVICTLKVKLYISSANYKEALRWGREALHLLGVQFPSRSLKFYALKEFISLRAKLLFRDIDSLIHLPSITNQDQLDAMELLVILIPASYLSNKELFAFNVLHGLNLTLQWGNAPMSPYIYASYGIIMNAFFDDFNISFTFGKLALELSQKFEDQKYVPATKFLVGTFLSATQRHLRYSIDILQTGYELGTSTGDFINAVFCQGMMVTFKYILAYPIPELIEEIKVCLDYVVKIKSHNRGYVFFALRQATLALTGQTHSPSSFQSDTFSEEAFFQMLRDNNFLVTLYFAYTFKMQLCFLFGAIDTILQVGEKTDALTFCVLGQPLRIENDFYHALALASACISKDRTTKRIYQNTLRDISKRLQRWAAAVPDNYLHKSLLVEAECARLEEKRDQAIDLYDRAIQAAKETGYIQNEGIACELFANFYLAQNRIHLAKQYLIEAHYAFYRWGASAKTAQLEQKYGTLLPTTRTLKSTHTIETAVESSSTSAIDLMTVIKAGQVLSGQIVLEQLLGKLMHLVVETAGAQKALLLMEQAGIWYIEAEYSTEGKTTKPHTSVKERAHTLALSVVNFVIRTKEQLLLDDATEEARFNNDIYILQEKPQSLLCIPLIHQSKLVGILYLENNLTTRAFTPERVEILQLLTGQIATSLENSQLYQHQAKLSKELLISNEKLEDYSHNLEKKVYERTKELNDKNNQLEETLQQIKEMQKKLIEQEKLVSTASVTKSIAVEMRNPLSYIRNFADLSENLLKEIEEGGAQKESLSLLHANLSKIVEHSKKADQTITSMLQQSQENASSKELTDINKLIRDYADLVYYNYYKNNPLFSLTIETDYDPTLPSVSVYPRNLGRVFYNIIDNACYAMKSKKEQLGTSYAPILSISTKNFDDYIFIKVRDNGIGIEPSILRRIFSPFLTTKPSGKSAGMGLSISHDIIVDDHGGTLTVDSEPSLFTEVSITLPKFS